MIINKLYFTENPLYCEIDLSIADFIRKWWESEDEVTLITCPRRLGKTLNMGMLEQFFSVDYAAQLISRGIPEERIHSYGFAFEGKKVLIG